MWFGNERWHVPSWDGFGGTIVKQDEILWQGGRVNRNVHDSDRPAEGIVAWAGFFYPSSRRVRFIDDRNVPAMEGDK